MSHLSVATAKTLAPALPVWNDIPILYEDEGFEEMGDANLHTKSDEILHVCLCFHVQEHDATLQVFRNMNLYYLPGPPHPETGSLPYISPDNMIVRGFQLLPEDLVTYTIGKHGPPPLATTEVLSKRSAQQRDLKEKIVVCAKLGVQEYILVDETRKFLKQRLLLKRLSANGKYQDEQDSDGGITSQLGFRLIFEEDGLRVVDLATGRPYPRPMEAEKEARARRLAEEQRRQADSARFAAEERLRQEAEARLKAEQELRRVQEELKRLRKKKPKNKD